MRDEKGIDDKIIAVSTKDPAVTDYPDHKSLPAYLLREIKRFMTGFSHSTPPSVRWRAMATAKLDELDRRAEEVERMRSVLRLGLECDCLTFDQCELLEN